MNNPYIEKLERYLADGKKYKAHSYNVSGDFLMSLLDRLKHDEATIEKLHELLSLSRIRDIATTTNESKP